jgi:hypothetical protein
MPLRHVCIHTDASREKVEPGRFMTMLLATLDAPSVPSSPALTHSSKSLPPKIDRKTGVQMAVFQGVRLEGCRIVEAVNTRVVGQTKLREVKNDRTIMWSFKSSHSKRVHGGQDQEEKILSV